MVTKDWAKILINCLKFDDKTIVAVPATPNVCNYQMLEVPTNDPDEFLLEHVEKDSLEEFIGANYFSTTQIFDMETHKFTLIRESGADL